MFLKADPLPSCHGAWEENISLLIRLGIDQQLSLRLTFDANIDYPQAVKIKKIVMADLVKENSSR